MRGSGDAHLEHGLTLQGDASGAPALRATVLTQAFALAAVAALAGLSRVADVPFSHLSRDPATALGGPFVTGYLSYLGACLWCAAAAVATFSALLVRGSRDGLFAFFAATALLGGLMLADDLFMLHDGLVPYLLGDVERWNLAFYGTLAAAYFLAFARHVRRTCLPLLAAAGIAFAGSVLVDAGVLAVPESRRHLLEDGLKFLGIANWAAWVTMACHRRLRPEVRSDGA